MADAQPMSAEEKAKKKEEEKQRKKEEKAKREAEKEANRKAREEAQQAKAQKALGASVTLADYDGHAFGNMFIQSHAIADTSPRTWTEVEQLGTALKGKEVWVRGRAATVRVKGKLCFIALRSSIYTVQAVCSDTEVKDISSFAANIPKESVIDIYGEVTVPEQTTTCTQQDVELAVKRLFVISRAAGELPLQLEDAARPDDAPKEEGRAVVSQDIRLNNRVIDLRTAANQGIFRMQHGGFTEIHTPKLIGTASEGGSDVFTVEYFGRKAYLAQSPQLYKQMALMADLERVFEVAPVFRSENSLTHRHMCEFTGLDMEMCFYEHYHEVLDMLDKTFNAVFDGLNAEFKAEQEAVRKQHPFNDLRYKYPCLKFTYPEAMAILRDKGTAKLKAMLAAETEAAAKAKLEERIASVSVHGDTEDIGTEDEKLLGVVIAEEYGQDFYMIDKFPAEVRPFYTMPDPEDPRFSNSYDIFIRGEEVTSGAQRIHDSELLLSNAAAKEPPVDLTPIQSYVDSFKYGAFPHAGGGIGLERVVMLFLGLPNIRKSCMFPRDPKRLTP